MERYKFCLLIRDEEKNGIEPQIVKRKDGKETFVICLSPKPNSIIFNYICNLNENLHLLVNKDHDEVIIRLAIRAECTNIKSVLTWNRYIHIFPYSYFLDVMRSCFPRNL